MLRALGATPGQTWADDLIGIFGSVVAGAVLALVVAFSLSPLSPLGPVRPVYPDPGLNFDWTVLGLGMVALVVVLGAIAAGLSFLGAPHRSSARRAWGPSSLRACWLPEPPPGCPSPPSPAYASPWSRGEDGRPSPSAPPSWAR